MGSASSCGNAARMLSTCLRDLSAYNNKKKMSQGQKQAASFTYTTKCSEKKREGAVESGAIQ
eukprot:m.167547 g.167547  ORF g.167547 m.167547 type:complete len:62 (+) comp16454_c0_seq6:680-865(+)